MSIVNELAGARVISLPPRPVFFPREGEEKKGRRGTRDIGTGLVVKSAANNPDPGGKIAARRRTRRRT